NGASSAQCRMRRSKMPISALPPPTLTRWGQSKKCQSWTYSDPTYSDPTYSDPTDSDPTDSDPNQRQSAPISATLANGDDHPLIPRERRCAVVRRLEHELDRLAGGRVGGKLHARGEGVRARDRDVARIRVDIL